MRNSEVIVPVYSSRRGFLGLAGGAAGAVLLSACGSGSGGGSSTPKRGGTLRAAFPGAGAKENMDPHVGRQFVDLARHKAVFDKLVDLGPHLEPVPRLARSWESNADTTVWRFRLRKADFHDGKPLQAEDVLFTLARILDPKHSERTAKSTLSLIDLKRSKAVGHDTVELVLNRPNAELPALLAFTGTAVVSRRYRDPNHPVGTGPFRFTSFTAGRSFTGRRFADYWDGPAHVDELRILSAETEARSNAVRAGEVEYAHEMSPTFARTVHSGSGVRIVSAPSCGAEGFLLKTDRPPFDDPDAAMAVKLLVDRKRLLEVVCGGRGALGNDMFGKGFEYYPTHVPQRERDVAEARKLLRRTGLLNKKVTLYTSTAADSFVDAAHLLARQAADAGLHITVTTGPPETYYTDVLRTGQIASHRTGAAPIPTYIAERLVTGAPQNVTRWERKDFDDAFHKAQATKDTAKRTERYQALQKTVRDKGGLVIWGHPNWLNAVRTRVHGVKPAAPNTVDWARFNTAWLD